MPPTDPAPMGEHVTIAVAPSPQPKVLPEEEKMEMPQFYEQIKQCDENIKKIKNLTELIEKQHSQSVMSVNEDEKALCSQKLENLVAALTQASAATRTTLRNLDAKTRELEPLASKGSGSLRMRAMKQRSCVDSFTKAMKEFKKMQEKYNKKYQDQLERQVKIVNPQVSKEEMKKILDDPEGARQMIFDIGRKKGAQEDLNKMKDRFEDVKKIAESIAQLQQMFMEMDEMITQQGDIINRIEYSVGNVENFTEEAKVDLGDALDSQKSIQKKKWLMIILVIVLIIVVLMALAYIAKNLGITNALKSKK